ncbi:MAG: hypothetical protein K9K40_13655 [Desulfotignum sp.]|nr:hypothetical protein [Desulfotignum sp.]
MQLDNFVEDPELQHSDIIYFTRWEMQKNDYKLGQIITIRPDVPSHKGVVLTIGWKPDVLQDPQQDPGYTLQTLVSPFYHKRIQDVFISAEAFGITPDIRIFDSAEQILFSGKPVPKFLLVKQRKTVGPDEANIFRKNAGKQIKQWIAQKKIFNFNAVYHCTPFDFVLTGTAGYWGVLSAGDLEGLTVLLASDFENWQQTFEALQQKTQRIQKACSDVKTGKKQISTLITAVSGNIQDARKMLLSTRYWQQAAHFIRQVLINAEFFSDEASTLKTWFGKWNKLVSKKKSRFSYFGDQVTGSQIMDHICRHCSIRLQDHVRIPDDIPDCPKQTSIENETVDRYRKRVEELKTQYNAVPVHEDVLLRFEDELQDTLCIEDRVVILEQQFDRVTQWSDQCDEIILEMEQLLEETGRQCHRLKTDDRNNQAVVTENMATVQQVIQKTLEGIDDSFPFYGGLIEIQGKFRVLHECVFEDGLMQWPTEAEKEAKQLIAMFRQVQNKILDTKAQGLFNMS